MENVKEILQNVVEEINSISSMLDTEDSVVLEEIPDDEVVVEEVVEVIPEEAGVDDELPELVDDSIVDLVEEDYICLILVLLNLKRIIIFIINLKIKQYMVNLHKMD